MKPITVMQCLKLAEIFSRQAAKAKGKKKASLHVKAFYYRRKAKQMKEARIVTIVKRRQPARYLKIRKGA